ncbi:hypothetical protein [Sinomicrobium sp. M5D2P17]
MNIRAGKILYNEIPDRYKNGIVNRKVSGTVKDTIFAAVKFWVDIQVQFKTV